VHKYFTEEDYEPYEMVYFKLFERQLKLRRPKTVKKHEKRLPLSATDSGPKPGDFPIGSPECRAAARSILVRQSQEIEVLIIDDWPKNSHLSQDPKGRCFWVLERPVEGAEKPISETTFEGGSMRSTGPCLSQNSF
jgi:hypothetical protein